MRSLRTKLVVSILVVGLVSGLLVLGFIYFSGTHSLKQSIGRSFQELAETVSMMVEQTLEHHVEEARLLAATSSIQSTVKESNAFFLEAEEGLEAIRSRIEEIESRWVQGVGVNAYLIEILNNRATRALQEFLKDPENRSVHRYILLTNRFGAVVAATRRPDQFDYSQKPWWQAAFNDGLGNVFIGSIQKDPEDGELVLEIATPVMGNNQAIGVLLMVHRVETLFQVVSQSRLGQTDKVILVDDTGRILFSPIPTALESLHPELTPMLFQGKSGWVATRRDVFHPGKEALNGFAPVILTLRGEEKNFGGHSWYVVISQDPRETYGPIYRLLQWIALSGLLGALIVGVLGYLAAGRIVRPIQALQQGAERIGRGELDYRIQIRTGDEIEDLAARFNDMAARLKLFYIKLEEMVKERTRELERRTEELSLLYTVTSSLNQALSLEDTLEASLQTLMERMKADAGAIWMLDPQKGRYVIAAARGLPQDRQERERLEGIFDHVADQIITSGHLWTSENLTVDPRMEGFTFQEGDFLALTGIPLRSKDKVIAILYLLHRQIRALTTWEEQVLESLGSHIGIAIENARLFARLLHQNEPPAPEAS